MMKIQIGAVLAMAATLGAGNAQPAANNIETHLAAAKAAAQFDFTGTLARVCIAPQTGPGRDVAPAPAPPRANWITEPGKVFDNLYFVGTKIHSSWALVGNQGIILIDTLFDYATDDSIIQGLRKVGLDPANIKYVIVSHAHGDHVGGAKMIQDRFKPHLVLTGTDWDSISASQNQYPNGKPTRDIAATDGQVITLGDVSVRLVTTPGHTPGTLSFLFDVKDNGKPLTVAYSGGTAFNFINEVPHFDTYIASQRKMAEAAAWANATVLISNHSEFDQAVTKLRLIQTRKMGEPHPFEVGKDAVARYFKVTDECAQVARAKLQ